jgi:hypothetical protein
MPKPDRCPDNIEPEPESEPTDTPGCVCGVDSEENTSLKQQQDVALAAEVGDFYLSSQFYL